MKWLAEKVYSGAVLMIDWCYGRMKWLACKVYSGLAFAVNWSWIQMKRLIEEAWDRAIWMAKGRTIRKVIGGDGEKNKKKFMRRKMLRKKFVQRRRERKKNSCRRKVQL